MTSRDIHMSSSNLSESDMIPSTLVPGSDFTTDDKTKRVHVFHATEDMSVSTGVWFCAPCRQEFDAFPVNEMMQVPEGKLQITDSYGNTQNYSSGDTLFVPKSA